MTTSALSENHLQMLRDESGITAEIITARGYRTVTDKSELERRGFSKNQQRTPGLLLPIKSTDGGNGLFQFRPDHPRLNEKQKPVKYETAYGAAMRVDCPPPCREQLGDPNVPLWLTEGVKKGDSLASRGFCAVALLGVWNFKGKNEHGGVTVLADFDYIAWKNVNTGDARKVFICFDSDVSTKKEVQDALERLNQILTEKGANVGVVYLPDLPSGAKCGVDDFLKLRGKVELEKLAESAKPFVIKEANEWLSDAKTLKPLQSICLADSQPENINWLWKPFLLHGGFCLVDGAEGLGKSLLTLAIGAAVANGNGCATIGLEPSEPANVLLVSSAENAVAYVIVPRLMAMDADRNRFHAITEPFVFDETGFMRLEMKIAETNARLIIIDPLFSFTGKANIYTDSDVKQITDRLNRIAEKYGCCIWGVRHINKSKGFGEARAAGMGGVGWNSGSRSTLLIGEDSETGEKAVCHYKTNFGELSKKSFGFAIETAFVTRSDGEQIETGKFSWTGESALTKERMLSATRDEDTRNAQSEAVDFLRDALSDGERESEEVKKEANKIGLSEQQLRTARSKLGVKPYAKGFSPKKWFWNLPNRVDVDSASTVVGGVLNNNQHLRENLSDNFNNNNSLLVDVGSTSTINIYGENSLVDVDPTSNQHLRVNSDKQITYGGDSLVDVDSKKTQHLRTEKRDQHLRETDFSEPTTPDSFDCPNCDSQIPINEDFCPKCEKKAFDF